MWKTYLALIKVLWIFISKSKLFQSKFFFKNVAHNFLGSDSRVEGREILCTVIDSDNIYSALEMIL